MSIIDVKKLLEKVSSKSPCGENLEYDPAFAVLERESQGKTEQQIGQTIIPAEAPNWCLVRDDALKLFSRTKDLRIATTLTRALLNTAGLKGLRDGLNLTEQLLQQHWDEVHPQLDPEDNNDPTLRVNALASLCDRLTLLHELRETPVVESRALGQFCLRDVGIASGKLPAPSDSSRTPPQMAEIDAAFIDADPDLVQTTADAVNQSLEHAQAIETLLTDRIGQEQTIDLSPLSSILMEAQEVISNHLTNSSTTADVTANDDDSTTEPTLTLAQPMTGEINSREDVIRALDSACDYFAKNEPSSPVPLLLRRAKRLISKDFMTIMQDIAPNAVSQVEAICGPDAED